MKSKLRPLRFFSNASGIEAASVAWKDLGWECVGVCDFGNFQSLGQESNAPVYFSQALFAVKIIAVF
jgi:hypothetical protein